MAAYNGERYIGASIRSVLAQSYANWELLIVNDGSTDKTRDIIQNFNDPRIRYFEQQNKGVSAARNKGLLEMKGEYFCFLDADDYFPPESIALRVFFMQDHRAVDLLDGVVEVKDEKLNNIIRVYRPFFVGNPSGEFVRLNDQVFFGLSLFIRRKGMSYRFEEGMTHAEDLWFYTKLAWIDHLQYDHISDLVYVYRKYPNTAMANLPALEKGYIQYYKLVKELPGISPSQTLYLKRRITRIMVLSYLRRLNIINCLKIIRWCLFSD